MDERFNVKIMKEYTLFRNELEKNIKTISYIGTLNNKECCLIKESWLNKIFKSIKEFETPKEFEYVKDLPKTLVGKVAYTKLGKETKKKKA